jgi:hypothetical protein
MAGNLTAMIAAAFSGSAAPPVTSDPYYEYTTLLLPGNGTNGAQNNTFLDSSTNNFTITRNGNTTQGTFSPFSQTGWGNYFDGSVDSLSLASNAVFAYGTSDFTWEVWVFPTASTWTSGSGNFYIIEHATNGGTLFYYQNRIAYYNPTTGTGSALYTSGGTVAPNQWSHIAVSRESGTTRIYVNGQLSTSGSDANNYAAQAVTIGRSGGGTQEYFGYMSNVRIVKGRAVYTSAFTPPTAPLGATSGGQNPPQGTETSLLTCQSNRFKDNSTNNFTITVNGSPSVQAFSPFNPSASWSAATYGGSGYFDGTSDYLNLGGQSAFAFGTGDFTLEGWFYFNALSNSIYDARPSGTFGGNYLAVGVLSNGQVEVLINTVQISAGAVTVNQWTHIAITRSGTDLRLFVNGTQAGSTVTNNTNLINGASRPTIGANGANTGLAYVNGYIGGYRVVTGTAVYTSNFTPPTAPLTATQSANTNGNPSAAITGSATSLLLNFTNAGIYDATSKNDLETVGNAQISTTQSKWGGSSMAFDGTGDWLQAPNNNIYNVGASDFTIEFWLYVATNPAAAAGVVYKTGYSSNTGWWVIYYPGYIGFGLGIGSALVQSAAASISTTTWTHVAITRSGTTGKIFINGIQSGSSGTINNFTDSTTVLAIGALDVATGWNASYPLNGYIQDLRITRGYARYTANFTPPIAAFPTL